MERDTKDPHPTMIGGVPEAVFTPGYCNRYTTASAHVLNIMMSKELISILDEIEESQFVASVDAFDRSLRLSFVALNKTKSSQYTKRHPGIYPGRLLRRSIDYFEEENDKSVQYITGNWFCQGILSDNYKQYVQALQELGSHDYNAQREAAWQTWTGGQMRDLGFTEILKTSVALGSFVSITFMRPWR